MVSVWLKEVSFPFSSLDLPRLLIPSFTVTASTFTAIPAAPIPTPATVDSISRWVFVFTARVFLAFSVLLSTMVLTVSLKVVASTPTPIPASNAPAPVPVASLTLTALAVSILIVSAVSSLPAMRLVTFVSILFTAILLEIPALKMPTAAPTETSWASRVVLLLAPMERFVEDHQELLSHFFRELFSTSAVTVESSLTTPTPTFREPAAEYRSAEIAAPASTFRL